MVVMDTQDYTDKALSLLTDFNTYRITNKDSANRLKNKLASILRDIKQTGGFSDSSYRKVYPTIGITCCPPKVLWPPQNSQNWHPLRPFVSSRGSITYGVAKELANIICPLVDQSPYHLQNTQHFVLHIQQVRLEPGEVITLYDVKALFTSVPVDPSMQLNQQKLLQDPTLSQKTNMSIQQIVMLLKFCLKNTYFLFQGKYYKQVHSAAIGSPIRPLITYLFMEEFEVKALSTASDPNL